MSDLAEQDCKPCRGDTPPLAGQALNDLLARLGNGWTLTKGHHLEKTYTFANFVDALAFVNRVGEVAEQQGHHPDLELGWGRVKITLWTHSVDGLTEADFVLAAKADQRL